MPNVTFTVTGSPLPLNFRGDPQAFFEAILERMRVQTPFGITGLILEPSVLPTSNKGPVIFNRAWYTWNNSTNQYEPVDITPSIPNSSEFSDTEPTDPDVQTWYETDGASTIVNVWVKFGGVFQPLLLTQGTTAQRPAAPRDFQQYYDTTIETAIWWERSAWRTISGVRGDVKSVVWATAEEAQTRNPGWKIMGESSLANNSAWNGRVINQASKNGDGTHPLAVGASITRRQPGEVFGVENLQLTADNLDHTHAYGHWTGNNDDIQLSYRASGDPSAPITVPSTKVMDVDGEGPGGTSTMTVAHFVTLTVSEFQGDPIENQQPTLSLWHLVKE